MEPYATRWESARIPARRVSPEGGSLNKPEVESTQCVPRTSLRDLFLWRMPLSTQTLLVGERIDFNGTRAARRKGSTGKPSFQPARPILTIEIL